MQAGTKGSQTIGPRTQDSEEGEIDASSETILDEDEQIEASARAAAAATDISGPFQLLFEGWLVPGTCGGLSSRQEQEPSR